MTRHSLIPRFLAASCVACLLFAAPAPAAEASASAPRSLSKLDNEPIAPRTGSTASANTAPHSQTTELPRVGGALALVIGLIFVMQWGARKLFRNGGGGRSTRAVQVLARAPLAPRQHVVLLRVGRRVLVIGDTGTQMNSLCEITDADEIAALLGQLQDEKSAVPTRAFGALFSRARDAMDERQEEVLGNDTASEMPDPAHAETADAEASISGTRDEITGLMDKIRTLSTHFRSGQT